MATTYNDNGGNTPNGSHLNFTYTFPVIKNADVKVALNGITQATTKYTVNSGVNPTRIEFNNTSIDSTLQESTGAPKTGVVVRVYRDTGLEDPADRRVTFQAGSAIRAQDLNNMYDHLIYSTQEEQNQLERITDADVIPTAEIQVSKLKDGAARQVLQTDAAGTGVEWTNDVDVPGTLDVTGATDLDGTLNVDGVSTLASLNVTGATGVDGDFDVNTNKFTVAASTGNTTIAGTLTVTGTTNLANDSIGGSEIAADAVDSEHIAAGAVDLEHMSANSVSSAQYVDGSIDLVHMSANSVDSDQYVDGSIDTAHIGDLQVTTAKIAADAITGAKIADDVVNSEHIAAGAVDLEHMSANSVDSDQYVDGSIDTVHLADNAVTEDKISAGGTPGADKVLVYDSGEATNWKWADQSGSGGSTLTVQEEGSSLSTAATTLNFVGANVTASGTGATKTITVSGSGEITVQDEGSALSTAATTLNFVGAGVTASGTGATKTITISGGGGAVTTDFQYLELKAHNNASGAFSAGSADYELVTKGTTTAVSPGQAAAMLISIGGVLQEPNTGTSIGSNDGFCIDGSSIHFGANLTAHPEYIIWMKGSGSHVVADNSVTTAKIADNAVTGAKIALGSDAAGDIMYYNGTDYVRLAKGTNGHYLKQGTSNAPEWAAVSGGSDTTYSISCVDGDNSDEEKIRLTAGGSGSGTDDVVLEAGTGLSVARSGDKITFTNTVTDTNTNILAGGTITGDVIFDNATNAGNDLTWDMSDNALEFDDNVKATFGDGADIQIYHDSNHSYITNTTGDFTVSTSSTGDDLILQSNDDILIRPQNGENGIYVTGNGSVELYYDNVNKFNTDADGVEVKDNDTTVEISLIDSNGTAGHIYGKDTDGEISILVGSGEHAVKCIQDAGVSLYYDNSEKVRTTSTGFKTLGNAQFDDNRKAEFGDAQDLQIYHDGTNSYVKDIGSNSFILAGNEIILKNSDIDENYMICTNDGSVKINNDNVQVFETHSSGIKVGQVGSTAEIWFPDSNNADEGLIRYRHDEDWMSFITWGAERFRIEDNGDLLAHDTSIGLLSSDNRLKKNVADYNYDLTKFKQLKPRTFEWKNTSANEHPTGTQKGFIAQEVETVDTSLTMEVLVDEANTADRALLDADGKCKSTKLGGHDALYVSVIQQLITKIETLETKVAALEAG